MRSKVPVIATLAMMSSPLDAGRAPPHSTRWVVAANQTPAENVTRNKDGYFRIGTVIPAALYRPTQDISVVTKKGNVTRPAGKLFVRLQDDPRKYCEMRNSRGSAFDCLADTDGDGKADTFFGTQVFNEIFLGSIGDDGGFAPLVAPVDLVAIDPRTNAPRIDLELKYDGMSGNVVKYRTCMLTSWESKYYGERSCLRKSLEAQLDATGSAMIYGQKIRFEGVRGKPPSIHVEYGRKDFEFPTYFTFP
jgi:hypothetical protein